ncbi:MAG: ABC transporter substrate-binding protein [Myxococcales bacterium]|nr:ABC transporter substrate-binding protein [Myxococcales bacterium]MCB9733365.1 ABC transporter substrate-binding protein [Deltaproteobacteria bacterium]
MPPRRLLRAPVRRALLAVAGALFVAQGVGACSLALDFDAECSRDDQCGRGEECLQGFCELPPLVDPDPNGTCTRIIGPDPREADPGTVILLGSLLPKSGDLGPLGQAMENGVELAVTEVNQIGGVLGRKIAVLACDDGTDIEKAKRSAKHLVDVARVPAIIGAGASSITIDVFSTVARPAGVLMMSPASTSPAITSLPDDGLLWRTAPSDAIQGRAVAGLIAELGYARVAVVNRDDAYGNGLAQVVQLALCGETGCGDAYASYIYPPDSADPAQATRQAAIIGELEAFTPDVVVLVGFVTDGVAFLNLASGKGFRFILTDGMKSRTLLGDRLATPDPTEPGVVDTQILCDLVGTNPGSPNPTNFRPFEVKYEARFGGKPNNYEAQAYDAAYAIGLAYAAAEGAGHADPDGRALAVGLTRLVGGASAIRSGPDDWNVGVTALSGGPTSLVDLTGVSGLLDFDTSTGEASGTIDLWRFAPDAADDDQKIENLGVVLDDRGQYIAGVLTARPSGGACGSTR